MVDVTFYAGVDARSATFMAIDGFLVTHVGIVLLFELDTISNG